MRTLAPLLALSLVATTSLAAQAPPPATAPPDEHQHHHHHGGGMPAAEPSASQMDMEGGREAQVREDTPEIAALKARFSVDYMLKPAQRRQLFDQYLTTLGTQGLLDVLEKRNPFCHDEAHELGRAVYVHFNKDVGKALSECGPRCSSACLHGVLKEAFGTSTIDQVRPLLATVCTQGAMADIRRPGNCAHGLGHALMMVAGNDVEKAIDGCSGFDGPAMGYYCVTGVYMELFNQAATWVKPGQSAFHPCDVSTRFPAACYRYQATRMLGALGGDRAELAEMCRSLPAGQRSGCFHGVGFTAMTAVAENPGLIRTVCPEEPGADQTLCLEGLIESLAVYQPAKAQESCGHLAGAAAEICRAAAREGTYRLDKPSLPLYLEH